MSLKNLWLRHKLIKNMIRKIKYIGTGSRTFHFYFTKEMWEDREYIIREVCNKFPPAEVVCKWESGMGKVNISFDTEVRRIDYGVF